MGVDRLGPGAFAASRDRFEQVLGWLEGNQAAGLTTASWRPASRSMAGRGCARCSRTTWTCAPSVRHACRR